MWLKFGETKYFYDTKSGLKSCRRERSGKKRSKSSQTINFDDYVDVKELNSLIK